MADHGPPSSIAGSPCTAETLYDSPIAVTFPPISLHISNPKLVPISPEISQRYRRRRTLDPCQCEYAVQPLSRSFLPENPSNWTARVHPEGGRYFVHYKHRIFTDSNLYDNAVMGQINSVVEHLLGRPDVQKLFGTSSESDPIDLVLDLMKETAENTECGYYFVDHSSRILIWLDVFHMSKLKMWKKVPGIRTSSHVKTALEASYWRHCDYFPSAMSISPQLIQELRGTIMFKITDAMTCPTTTHPFPVDHTFRMLQLTSDVLSDLGSGIEPSESLTDHGSRTVLARFMEQFAASRFLNLHGEQAARLDRMQSVYQWSLRPSYLLRVISPLLFNAPLDHFRAIEAMYSDRIIKYTSWSKLMNNLRSEWQDLILYGTLVLNTNVGLLAVPSENATGNNSLAQISSYISICMGLGSITIGLVLLRLNRLDTTDAPAAETAAAFFLRHENRLDFLSIVYSLPYGLMVWGMITFFIALLGTAFRGSNTVMRGILLATVTVICFASVCSMLVYKPFAIRLTMARAWVNSTRCINTSGVKVRSAVARLWWWNKEKFYREEKLGRKPQIDTIV